MEIDLRGVVVGLTGDTGEIAEATARGLAANGAHTLRNSATLPDILILFFPLRPQEGVEAISLIEKTRTAGEAMRLRGHGRILFILSASAGIPMRRHGDYSVQMAAALAGMRTIAMQCGPTVLVNAVGVGAIGSPIVAGDAAMLGHASVKRAGTVAEVVDTVLFFCDPANTYTTGQMLSVDGGWSVGYGRSF